MIATPGSIGYLIGQTGVSSATADFGGGGSGNGNISTGTNISINFNDIQGVTPEAIQKMTEISAEALRLAPKKEEQL